MFDTEFGVYRWLDPETDLYEIFETIDKIYDSLEDLSKSKKRITDIRYDVEFLEEEFSKDMKKVYAEISLLRKTIFEKERENIIATDKRLRTEEVFNTVNQIEKAQHEMMEELS